MVKHHELSYESFEFNTSTLNEESLDLNNSKNKIIPKYYFTMIFIFSVILSLFVVIYIKSVDKIVFINENDLKLSKNMNKLNIISSNEYGIQSTLAYSWLNDGLLVEPYKLTTLSISNPSIDCTYLWEITDETITIESQTNELTINILATTHGNFDMRIYETCGSNTVGYSNNIYVKHVRRELRSLTTEDREEFLDSLKILYDVNTIDGQRLYGSNYKSLYYFLSIHVDAAGNPVCDEFHSGAGFLSNHVFLSNYLEQSLQAVNPKTALHYMEYVNDFSSASYQSHLDNQLDGGSWTELFSSTYFGENDPYTGKIINGRWKDTIIPYMTDSFFEHNLINKDKTFFPNEEDLWLTMSSAHLKSPFGLLRPPWNYNPSSYISRYNNEAGILAVTNNNISDFFIGTQCSDVTEFLTEFVINKNLDSYLLNVKNYHTKVHDGIGGQGGENAKSIDNYLINQYNLTNDDIIVIIQSSSKFYKKYLPLKDYYTSTKYPIYPLVCSENPWEESTESLSTVEFPSCQCNDYYYQSEDNLNTLIKIYFDKFAFESTIQYNNIKKIMLLDYSKKLDVMKKLCSRLGLDGDMVGSASSVDPIFWVSHGSVEKLYQKLIINDLFLDLQYTASSSSCSGHAPWGKKDWLDGYKFINTDIEVKDYTNAQLSDILNPNSIFYRDLISYVYDGIKSNCEDVEGLLSK